MPPKRPKQAAASIDLPKNACSGCNLPVAQVNESLQCDICEINFHPCCAGFTDSVFQKFLEMRDVTGWVCRNCRKETSATLTKLQASHASLAEEVTKMKLAIEQLQLSSTAPPTPTPISYADALMSKPVKQELHREMRSVIKDSDRRSHNVVISGLAEVEGRVDVEIVGELFERNLPIKPLLDVNSCKRVGKVVSGRPRKLLVALRSAAVAKDLLKCAKELRNSSDTAVKDSVYINKDLSPEEAKAAYELRVKRRAEAANTSPVTDVTNSEPNNSDTN